MLNLTQHKATPAQVAEGVVELEGSNAFCVKAWLTFDELPTQEEIQDRALFIASLANDALQAGDDRSAMIGGAPYLMPSLHQALVELGITPRYAFSRRVSEEKMVDGVVTKVNVFVHAGFI